MPSLLLCLIRPTLSSWMSLSCCLTVRFKSASPPILRLPAVTKAGEGTRRVLREVSEDFMLQLVKETDRGEEVLSVETLSDDTSPIIKLINTTILDALSRRASDIHIETGLDGVDIKYRIDGVLYKANETIDQHFQAPIISRLKVMSELDISERRIPQDGRFKIRFGDKIDRLPRFDHAEFTG